MQIEWLVITTRLMNVCLIEYHMSSHECVLAFRFRHYRRVEKQVFNGPKVSPSLPSILRRGRPAISIWLPVCLFLRKQRLPLPPGCPGSCMCHSIWCRLLYVTLVIHFNTARWWLVWKKSLKMDVISLTLIISSHDTRQTDYAWRGFGLSHASCMANNFTTNHLKRWPNGKCTVDFVLTWKCAGSHFFHSTAFLQ